MNGHRLIVLAPPSTRTPSRSAPPIISYVSTYSRAVRVALLHVLTAVAVADRDIATGLSVEMTLMTRPRQRHHPRTVYIQRCPTAVAKPGTSQFARTLAAHSMTHRQGQDRNVCFEEAPMWPNGPSSTSRETEVPSPHSEMPSDPKRDSRSISVRHKKPAAKYRPRASGRTGPLCGTRRSRRRGTRRAGTTTSGPSGRRRASAPPIWGGPSVESVERGHEPVVPQHQWKQGARRLHQPLPGLGDHC